MKQFRLLLATLLAFVCTSGAWADTYRTTQDGITYVMESDDVGYAYVEKVDASITIFEPKEFVSFDGIEGSFQVTGFADATYGISFNQESWEGAIIPRYFIKLYYRGVGTTSVFRNCQNLRYIRFVNADIHAIRALPDFAFENCTSLTSIVIPSKVERIPVGAFHGCTSLQSVTLPEGCEVIGNSAFEACPALTEINLSDVNEVGNKSFCNCSSLANADLSALESIGEEAFYGCTSLAAFSFSNSLRFMGKGAFQNCSTPTTLTLTDCNLVIGENAFWGTNINLIDCRHPNADGYVIPMNYNAFENATRKSQIEVKIPSGMREAYLKSYGWQDFNIVGGGTVISFVDDAVKELCTNSSWDTDGDGELSTDEAAAVETINQVFRENTEITSFDELKYFTGLTSIGSLAFNGCTNLELICIPEGVTSIGQWAFNGTKITSIKLPESLRTLSVNAFQGCNELRSVILPEGFETLSGYSIHNCTNLWMVYLPSSFSTIDDEAGPNPIVGCPSLTTIVVDEANETFDSRGGCNAVIRTSTNTLVAGCKSTLIPEDIQYIGSQAFMDNPGISKIEIPEGVIGIRDAAFQNCTNLKQVVAHMATPPSIGSTVFSGISNECVLVVPAGKKSEYISKGWTETVFKGGIVELAAGDELDNFVFSGTEAGGLYAKLSSYSDDQLKAIKKLTVNSPINSADFSIIRKLCGDKANDPYFSQYGLDLLDLTNASIVGDNNSSYDPYFKADNVICNTAFYSLANLAELKLPASATRLGYRVFMGATSDMIVHVPWTAPLSLDIDSAFDCDQFGQKANSDVKNMILVVPKGCLAAYQAVEGWNWFKEIREENEVTPEPSGNYDLNNDGKIDVGDVTKLVNEVLKQ